MRRIRTASRRQLAGIAAAVAAIAAGGGIAQAALGGADPRPAPMALDRAIDRALNAPAPAGISARVTFENGLLPGGIGADGGSPLVEGAEGRLWADGEGRMRLELQSSAGLDAQVVVDDRGTALYDPASKVVYRFPVADGRDDAGRTPLDAVQDGLARLGQAWTISGARPSSVAGRAAYTVRVAPKDDGGLLGAAELAWDAANGTPLRAAVYAAGGTDPVLELRADDVSFEAVPGSRLALDVPAGTRTVTIDPKGRDRGGRPLRVHGVEAVARRVGFPLAAPAELAGLPRTSVHLVDVDGTPGALVTYGKGLGAVAVLQSRADGAAPAPGSGSGLPQVNIDGATGTELATPLGTALRFARDGVEHLVIGSVPPVAAETVARGLR